MKNKIIFLQASLCYDYDFNGKFIRYTNKNSNGFSVASGYTWVDYDRLISISKINKNVITPFKLELIFEE